MFYPGKFDFQACHLLKINVLVSSGFGVCFNMPTYSLQTLTIPPIPLAGLTTEIVIRKCDSSSTEYQVCNEEASGCKPLDIGTLLGLGAFPGFPQGEACCCSGNHCNGPFAPSTPKPLTTTPMPTTPSTTTRKMSTAADGGGSVGTTKRTTTTDSDIGGDSSGHSLAVSLLEAALIIVLQFVTVTNYL